MMLISTAQSNTSLSHVTATNVAGHTLNSFTFTGTLLNPGLQKLVSDCMAEIGNGTLKDVFIEQLSHYNRSVSDRNLQTKFKDAGCPETLYDFAIEAKESFAKFFEVTARHPSGQAILVAAFKHAYSIFGEKINPYLKDMTFSDQNTIFENSIVEYLSHNLMGLPEFYGRMEALGLIYYLADNCFIEYAKCSV